MFSYSCCYADVPELDPASWLQTCLCGRTDYRRFLNWNYDCSNLRISTMFLIHSSNHKRIWSDFMSQLSNPWHQHAAWTTFTQYNFFIKDLILICTLNVPFFRHYALWTTRWCCHDLFTWATSADIFIAKRESFLIERSIHNLNGCWRYIFCKSQGPFHLGMMLG